MKGEGSHSQSSMLEFFEAHLPPEDGKQADGPPKPHNEQSMSTDGNVGIVYKQNPLLESSTSAEVLDKRGEAMHELAINQYHGPPKGVQEE